MCEVAGCAEPASYLFRNGDGPIACLCEIHARRQAAQTKLQLPDSPRKVLSAGW